jgi:hypothetical protein
MRQLRLTPGIVFVIAGALFASGAAAATLNVSPSGSGSSCTPGSPCALATANSMVKAGDVVRLAPGTYTTGIAPATDGSPLARITYVGNLMIPDAVLITPDVTVNRKYISVKGMSFAGVFGFDRLNATSCAQFDSVAYCDVYHSLSVDQAKDCMAYMVNVTGGVGRFTMSTPATPISDWTIPERDTVRRCTFSLGTQVTGGYHVVQIRGATHCVIDSNQVSITMATGLVNEINPFIAFFMRYCRLKDNRWEIMNTDGANQMMRWRDSSMWNRVYRDTIIMRGSGNCRFAPSSAGSYVGTTSYNYFEGLFVKCSTNPSDFALYYQNGMRLDTLRNCVVVDSIGKAFTCESIEMGPALIDHCTFAGNSTYSVAEVVAGVNQWGAQWLPGASLTFTNNILYQMGTGSPTTGQGMGYLFSTANDQLTSNGNLYFLPGVATNHSIVWNVNGAGSQYAAPGSGSTWATTYGRDVNSYWGSPQFVDSTFTTFDAHLRPGSFASRRALDGGDIGALSTAGPDVTPPAAVVNLGPTQVNDNSVVLGWTAPGNDGNVGTASAYDLRYSTSPIDATNFASATPIPAPAPVPAGGAQTDVVQGLTPGATYYFALRTRDGMNNWSALSNVPQVATSATDTRPPAAIKDLTVTP